MLIYPGKYNRGVILFTLKTISFQEILSGTHLLKQCDLLSFFPFWKKNKNFQIGKIWAAELGDKT